MGRTEETRIKELETEIEKWQLIFNSIHGGAIVTDPDGFITEISHSYCELLGINRETLIGTHCTELIDNTRMHIVAKTGKAEINQIQVIDDQNLLVRRVPVKKDGKVVAVVGHIMFENLQQLATLAKKFSLLESKVKHYEEELLKIRSTRYTFESIIGTSHAMENLKKEALIATSKNFPVLITGESGTGKELFAQAIHQGSPRNLQPFIRINCAAIPRELIESELFGYEKGAFTGARATGKPGKFELAHNGTIFLDEIGELPLDMQPKLLRVLEEKEFERVGGNRVIHSDFRLIAATNRNLEEMISQNRFRKDLFYRINVIPLHIPPLRERREDIGPISHHLLTRISEHEGLPPVLLSKDAEKSLAAYNWPGNVRELSNILERTMATIDSSPIATADLPYLIRQNNTPPTLPASSLKSALADAEKEIIQNALKRTDNNKTQAARLLGIHRTLLYKKMEKYGIET